MVLKNWNGMRGQTIFSQKLVCYMLMSVLKTLVKVFRFTCLFKNFWAVQYAWCSVSKIVKVKLQMKGKRKRTWGIDRCGWRERNFWRSVWIIEESSLQPFHLVTGEYILVLFHIFFVLYVYAITMWLKRYLLHIIFGTFDPKSTHNIWSNVSFIMGRTEEGTRE